MKLARSFALLILTLVPLAFIACPAPAAPIIVPGHPGATLPPPAVPGDNNKVLQADIGVPVWAFVVDANVASGAAIAGSKVVPTFGNQAISNTNAVGLSVGATPATAGRLRLTNADVIAWRNAANSANLDGLAIDASGNVLVGSASNADVRLLTSGGSFRLRTTGAWETVVPQDVNIRPASTTTAAANQALYQAGLATGSGQSSTGGHAFLAGGDATGTTAAFTFTGGRAELVGGDATGSGGGGTYVGGSVRIRPGTGATTTSNVFFGTDAAPDSAAQSMQAGLWVGDRVAAPTGNPTAGFFFWSESGVPTFRTSAGEIVNIQTDAAVPDLTETMSDNATNGDLEELDSTTLANLEAGCERNFTELQAKVNALILSLRNRGLIP